MLTRKQLALLHVAKTRLGMTEAMYRDLLAVEGVKSAKDLSDAAFDRLLQRLCAAGFKPKLKGCRKSRTGRAPLGRERLLDKIAAILTACDLPWAYAREIAKKRYNVDRLEWLGDEELHTILISLEYHRRRRLGAAKETDPAPRDPRRPEEI